MASLRSSEQQAIHLQIFQESKCRHIRSPHDNLCGTPRGYELVTTDIHARTSGDWVTAALDAIAVAANELNAAKRTRSAATIAGAQRELQNTVDAARDLDVEWGRIASVLGIARGNAYQRFRRKPPGASQPASSGEGRIPPL